MSDLGFLGLCLCLALPMAVYVGRGVVEVRRHRDANDSEEYELRQDAWVWRSALAAWITTFVELLAVIVIVRPESSIAIALMVAALISGPFFYVAMRMYKSIVFPPYGNCPHDGLS